MNDLTLFLYRRLHRFRLPAAVLMAFLQRTPAVRVAAVAEELVASSPVGALIRSAFALVSLGAVHSLVGATQLYVSPPDSQNDATVGVAKTFLFTVTGAGAAAGSWTVSNGPTGMVFAALGGGSPTTSGTINASTIQLSGVPNAAGTYSLSLTAHLGTNGSGDSLPYNHVIIVSGGATPTPTPTPMPTPTPVPVAVAPTFTTQPISQSAVAGGSITFIAVVAGSPAPTYQWQKDGAAIAGATGSSLTLTGVTATSAGSYRVIATNSAGTATSSGAVLTIGNAADLPVMGLQPQNVTVGTGGTVALAVTGTKVSSYQWMKNGVAVAGATSETLVIANATAASAGSYTAVLTNAAGNVSSRVSVVGIVSGVSRISNLSVRTNLASGQNLTVGFVTNGGKTLLLRAVGPSLQTVFGLSGVFGDPKIQLFNQSGMIATNDNWSSALSATFASLGAFPLDPSSKDAALSQLVSGASTAQISGTGSGTALVEVYDQDGSSATRLTNVSARNQVGTGADILVSGFVIDGPVAKTVLIRGVGPALKDLFSIGGALVDPKLELYTQANEKIAENDNWTPSVAAYFGPVGAYPFTAGSKDSALLITLPPGVYTAQVSGVAGATGDGVVEVYEVP